MSRSIAGLSVIVTGGARGIGRATVDRFVRAGARVAIGDLDLAVAQQAVDAHGDKVAVARLDVTDPDSWTSFLAEVEHLGPFDVLVNNAGIMPIGSILKESRETTRRIMDINVHGVINGVQAVAPGMVERGRGHIVNVASAVGRVAVPFGATYSASKFAVVGFSEALRQELEPDGIDVTVVLPTVVQTELSAGVPAARGIKPVTADDVAEVIEAGVRDPKAELWVPRWTQGLTKPTLAMPRAVQNVMTRLTAADHVFKDADTGAREAYEDRARRGE